MHLPRSLMSYRNIEETFGFYLKHYINDKNIDKNYLRSPEKDGYE